MPLKHELERLLAYDDWANREVLAALRSAGAPPARASGCMAHIIGAQRTWLHRLTGREQPEVWPALSLDQCAEQLDELRSEWESFLASQTGGGLAQPLVYANTKGREFRNAVDEVLQHVLLHGAYHRGQVVAWLREHGVEPPVTDFIHAAREGVFGDRTPDDPT